MPVAERLAWTPAASEDDLDWQGQDRQQEGRIYQLIQAWMPMRCWMPGSAMAEERLERHVDVLGDWMQDQVPGRKVASFVGSSGSTSIEPALQAR
jgi:hypothetical protein